MTPLDKATYDAQGYLVQKDLLAPEEIEEIKAEIIAVLRGQRGPVKGLRDYPENASDEEVMGNIAGLYHPHHVSDCLTRFIKHPKISEVTSVLTGPNVKCVQSMCFTKGPGYPGQAWHQDEVPIPSRDRSLTGVWIALDRATIENGCLWAIPRSHLSGILYERKPHDDPRYDGVAEAQDIPYIEEDAVPVELEPGSGLFFNGYLLHRSLNNTTTDQWRRSFVLHCMNAESWQGNENQHRNFVMMCGSDPYANKPRDTTSLAAIRNWTRM